MAQLGRAITILVKFYEQEHGYAADLAAFHAPSECYDDVFGRNAVKSARRERLAMRRALHAAGQKSRRTLRNAIRRQTGNDKWAYNRWGFVPY